jgi:hypothetical protein
MYGGHGRTLNAGPRVTFCGRAAARSRAEMRSIQPPASEQPSSLLQRRCKHVACGMWHVASQNL